MKVIDKRAEKNYEHENDAKRCKSNIRFFITYLIDMGWI